MLLSWVVKRSDAQRQAVRELRRSGVPEASRNERVACVEPTHRVRSQPQSGCSARPVGLERVTVTRGPIGQFTSGAWRSQGALEDSRRQGTTDVAPEGPVQIARARKPFEGSARSAWGDPYGRRMGARASSTTRVDETIRVGHRRCQGAEQCLRRALRNRRRSDRRPPVETAARSLDFSEELSAVCVAPGVHLEVARGFAWPSVPAFSPRC